MPTSMGRFIGAALIAACFLFAAPTPVAADPARPGDYRSEVIRVDPPIGGLVVEVVGGDSFMHVVAPSGMPVVIPGYDGEPYARISADGQVEINERSPSRYINQDRYGRGVIVPDSASAKAPPRWVRAGGGAGAGTGEFTWHDHRIHYMGGARQPRQDWHLELEVGDQTVRVDGVMTLLPAPNPLVPTAAGLAALLAVVGATLLGRRRLVVPALAALVAAAVALFIGWRQQTSVPAAVAGAPVITVGVPAFGVAAGLLGLMAHLRGRQLLKLIGVLGAVAAAGGWVLSRLGVFSHPVLPTNLAASADRMGTAAVAGLAVAAGAITVWLAAPALPALDDADDCLDRDGRGQQQQQLETPLNE